MSEPITLFRAFRGHRSTVTSVSFSSKGSHLITGSADKTVMVWSLKPSFRAFRWTGHKDSVLGVDFHPNGSYAASVGKDATARIWRITVSPTPLVISGLTSPLRSVSWSCHGESLACASDDKCIRVYSVDSLSSSFLHSTKKPTEQSASSAGVKFSHSFIGHNHWVNCVKFQPGDCCLLASGGEDGRLCIFDKRIGSKPLFSKEESGGAIYSLDYSPDGRFIATGSADGKVRVYDVSTTSLIALYEGHSGPCRSVKFGLGKLKNLIFSGSDDTSCRVWSLSNGCLLYTLWGHNAPVTGVAVSDCDSTPCRFATSGGDHVLLWEADAELISEDEHLDGESGHVSGHVEDIDQEQQEFEEEPIVDRYTVDRRSVGSVGSGVFTATLDSLPENVMIALEALSGQMDLINHRLDGFDQRLSILESNR
ncbi:hypothetical protein GEMRC1_013510 [Eukaryota sp. GEM-RC1]